MRLATPTDDRIASISSRLSQIQFSFEHSKKSRLEVLESHCKSVELQLLDSQSEIEAMLKSVSSELGKLKKKYEEDSQSSESFFEGKARELTDLEVSLKEILFKNEGLTNQKIDHILADRAESVKHEIHREKNYKKESFESISEYFNSRALNIQDMLSKEQAECRRIRTEVAAIISDRVYNIQETVVQDSRDRENSEGGLRAMIQEISTRFKNEIQEERAEREACEETLLGLLEETCNKLNNMTPH